MGFVVSCRYSHPIRISRSFPCLLSRKLMTDGNAFVRHFEYIRFAQFGVNIRISIFEDSVCFAEARFTNVNLALAACKFLMTESNIQLAVDLTPLHFKFRCSFPEILSERSGIGWNIDSWLRTRNIKVSKFMLLISP